MNKKGQIAGILGVMVFLFSLFLIWITLPSVIQMNGDLRLTMGCDTPSNLSIGVHTSCLATDAFVPLYALMLPLGGIGYLWYTLTKKAS